MGEVDWGALEHAYGKATDVPPLLEAIRAGKSAAVGTLANLVAHQGWCTPETARAVAPVLLSMTDELSGKTLAAVIVLLADLACAGSHEHVMGTGLADAPIAELLADPDIVEIRALLRGHEGATRWLESRSPAVRGAAALFIAVTEHAADLTRELAACAGREKNDAALADILIALGWAAADARVPVVDAVVRARGDERAAVRAAAWIATAHAGTMDDDTVLGLWEAVGAGSTEGITWAGGHLSWLAVEVLRARAGAAGRTDALTGALEHVSSDRRAEIGASLVERAFARRLTALGQGTAASRPALESLTDAERAALAVIARYEEGWYYASDQSFFLRKLALPADPPSMRTYLGEPPPPPDARDAPFAIDAHEGTLAEVLAATCTKEGLHRAPAIAEAIRASFSAGELVDVVEAIQKVRVPWGFTLSSVIVHVLVGAGPTIAAPVRDRLARYCRYGPPSWWQDGGKLTATALPMLLWAVLRQLDASAEVPNGFPWGEHARAQWERSLGGYEPAAAEWLRSAMPAS